MYICVMKNFKFNQDRVSQYAIYGLLFYGYYLIAGFEMCGYDSWANNGRNDVSR